MKKGFVLVMIAACLLMLLSPIQAAASSNLNVTMDGEKLDVAAKAKEGRTLVPVRGVFEKLGLHVNWDHQKKTAYISNDESKVSLTLGNKVAVVNGKNVHIDVPVTAEENRLYIPLRFVAEQFHFTVDWNASTKTVQLTSTSTESDIDVEEFLQSVIGADLTSYSTDMSLWQSMKLDGEELIMDMEMKMDMVLDPIGFYQYTAMILEELDGEKMESEAYFSKEGYYVSEMGQWIKYDDELVEDILNLSQMQMDPMYQYELLLAYAENVKVIEKDDTYMMSFSISGDGFHQLILELIGGIDLGLPEEELEMIGLLFENFDITTSTTFDKSTFYPLSQTMESNLAVTFEGDTMELEQKVEATYSNFNQIKEIKIPQEVIDSAIPFNEYIGEWELEDVEFDEVS
ncbi:copper amine oxidase N-terminal domain-containing protein [Alkalihalophilus marmarensis]|uniref:Copper amine oxidase-like N-terminal domain-containing protein n=1 Tax=Alkalihalophilus marmarensis DSM 21297 TaxID=1188261 RepID=U6SN46_9BACI|nr:copper amine oxidase N-terminal domain-containing protein [Alkalihalophilus marmarensis]ERN52056.1 hypothetical protein A33I_18355 [Alkalihalophilus marmarensis DSM 21297]